MQNQYELSLEGMKACARRARQVEIEGPTPPGVPDDWYWHDNCHTQRRRKPTVDGQMPDTVCKPAYGVYCQLRMFGERCDCLDPKEVAVFDMEA